MRSQRGRTIAVGGNSMWPIRAPMRVRISAARSLTPGDIAAFIGEDGRLIFHRVVASDTDGYTTRGDTNGSFDPYLPREAVIGRIDRIHWGPFACSFPATGLRAEMQRSAGLTWSQVAPTLRWAVRRMRTF